MFIKYISIIIVSLLLISPSIAGNISKANPIILLHGIAGFENIGPVTYWGKIAEALSKDGYKVYTLQTSPFSSVIARTTSNFGYNGGKSIINSVNDIVKKNGGKKAIIIGHSMGGLDARYIASPNGLNRGDLVDSVLSIGTPHRGTHIADLGLNVADLGNTKVGKIRTIGQKVMSYFGLSAPTDAPFETFSDLSVATAKDFNKNMINNPKVQYYSIAGVGKTNMPPELIPTHDILEAIEGANDGLVSKQSAQWGHYLGEWAATHQEETGLRHLDSLINESSEIVNQRNSERAKDAIDSLFKHRNGGTYVDSFSGGEMKVGNVKEALLQADNTEIDKATKSFTRRVATICVSRVMAAMLKD